MRKFIGVVCMLLGVAMMCGAGWLVYANYEEDAAAGTQAEAALAEMRTAMEEQLSPTMPALNPEATLAPERPKMEIDGEMYIGYLEMPTIGLTLPVMDEWSYPNLRKSPCRYWGSAADDSLVIMAHNYDRHFGKISSLEIGAPVQFVDADENIHRYIVAAHETLAPTDVAKMIDDQWDLTLFTCTYGGANRITVRLQRVLAF